MKCLALIIISMGLLSTSFGGHILVFHFTKTGSYVKIMDAVLQTIAPHHKITLYSIIHDEFPHPNVTVVPMKVPSLKSYFSSGMFETLRKSGTDVVNVGTVHGITEEFIDGIFADQHIKDLMIQKPKFDMLLTFVTFSEFSLQFAHVLNVPLVQISPTVPFTHINDVVGNPTFLSTTYNFFSQDKHDTFYKRVKVYLKNGYVHLHHYWVYMPYINRITQKYYPSGTPPVETVARNTSLLLANMNSVLGFARPTMPNVIEIGGIHYRPPKPVASDLEEFISGSGEHGIIYFSFGSSIRSKFPEAVTSAILRVFAKVPQRILWKWNEDIAEVPPNVKVSKWFSQQDILGHNKTRLFISQTGIFSLQEAAYHGVPVLSIPIAYDQHINGMVAEDLEFGEVMRFYDFCEHRFLELIQKITLNPKYKENAKRIQQLLNDNHGTISEKITWWLDYVIRHKGNPIIHNLKYRSTGLTRLDVDIVLFLFTSTVVGFTLIFYFIFIAISFVNTSLAHRKCKEKIT